MPLAFTGERKRFINDLKVDAQPIFEDDQSLKVWIDVEDATGQDTHIRVDLRWVSIEAAVSAIQNTFLVDLMYDQVEDKMDLTDCLCTRNMDGQITFYVGVTGGRNFDIPAYTRHRP
jgi:hypothetical protein